VLQRDGAAARCRDVVAGALDADQSSTERAQPGKEPAVAGDSGREALGAQHPAATGQRCDDVGTGVGVDTTGLPKLMSPRGATRAVTCG